MLTSAQEVCLVVAMLEKKNHTYLQNILWSYWSMQWNPGPLFQPPEMGTIIKDISKYSFLKGGRPQYQDTRACPQDVWNREVPLYKSLDMVCSVI